MSEVLPKVLKEGGPELKELVLELKDGRETRLRFVRGLDACLNQPCNGLKRCSHQISPTDAASLFRSVNVEYEGDPMQSAQQAIAEHKAELLFQALHTLPTLLDNNLCLTALPSGDREFTIELLELYLLGFNPQMLARHFHIGIKVIVLKLSLEVFGDGYLAQDPTKPRHQKPWHRNEILFLASQMQIGRTPTEISKLMERDALGIAFKLFDTFRVPIPRQVLDRYDIAIGAEPLGPVPLDGKPF